jgi:hypothetical protein
LHDDNPDALETILRYLYGLDPVDLPTCETAAAVIRSIQVIITADKYGIDHQLIENHTNMIASSVYELRDPHTVLSILKMCTVDSDIHPLLVSIVDGILRTHMGTLAEVPEWFDWTHSIPEVNRKIFREAAQMMDLKNGHPHELLSCGGCGVWVFPDPATNHSECSCKSSREWYLHERRDHMDYDPMEDYD